MNSRTTKGRSRQADSTALPFDNEASTDRKVLWVWKSLLEIFGPRWTETYGNDPLGKDDPAKRMGMWIEEIQYMSGPKIKDALYKLRRHQKPNDYWLPDLPTFVQFAGRGSVVAAPPREPERQGSWVDYTCGRYLFQSLRHYPSQISDASLQLILSEMIRIRAQYNEIAKSDETLTQEDVIASLKMAFEKIKTTTPEDFEIQRWRRTALTSSPGREDSNSSMRSGVSAAAVQ